MQEAKLEPGELVSIDTSREEWTEQRQDNIVSACFGISGRPDRILRSAGSIIPVELKMGAAPRSGPHEAQLGQLGMYCLLVEERFKTTVKEGVNEYLDRSIKVAFDAKSREWIVALIEEVREAKRSETTLRRSHRHPANAGDAGFEKTAQKRYPEPPLGMSRPISPKVGGEWQSSSLETAVLEWAASSPTRMERFRARARCRQ